MEHRRIQRTLFRMQLDPDFANRLRASEGEATRGLAPDELRLLQNAEPSAVSADRDGRRRAQFLANVSSEFPLSIAAGLRVDGFTASEEFHAAVWSDTSLPLALARYASRCCVERPAALRALVGLESALARARRELRTCRAPRPGELGLAPWVWLEVLPAGTLALAARIREALDADKSPPPLALENAPNETLLVRSAPPTRPLSLREVEVEHTSPALARLLRAALEPITRACLEVATSSARAELDPVIDGLLADRILLAGS